MKRNKLLILAILLSLLGSIGTGYGQLYIDEEGNAGIGIVTIPDARLKILNTTEDYTLQLENRNNTDNTKYGVHITVDNQGTGLKTGVHVDASQSQTATTDVYGYGAQVEHLGSGVARGFFAQVKEGGSGEKQGFYSTIRQGTSNSKPAFGYRADVIHFGSGISRGFYSSISGVGTGSKQGIYNEVSQPTASTAGLDGVYTNIFHYGTGQATGVTTYISSASTGTAGNVYGSFNSIYGASSAWRYGIYSHINGGTGYAGYFVGNVHVDGELTWTSDETLKENVADLGNALKIIDQIQPKTYNFRKSPNHGNNANARSYGFLAQDMEAILPDLVSDVHHPGRTRPTQEDVQEGDGTTRVSEVVRLEQDEDIKAINYIALIPILTQAIKEQQTVIQSQLSLIEALEARVKSLEDK